MIILVTYLIKAIRIVSDCENVAFVRELPRFDFLGFRNVEPCFEGEWGMISSAQQNVSASFVYQLGAAKFSITSTSAFETRPL